MLYTRKGDGGTTKTFGCDQRISKSSVVAEALGALDEANSFLGLARARTVGKSFKIESGRVDFAETILEAQQNLFIIQAEVAGAELSIDQGKVLKVETIVDGIEKILPPIKNFFISGVIAAREEGKIKMSAETLAYLNRLSSLLYALARLASHLEGAEEIKPDYK